MVIVWAIRPVTVIDSAQAAINLIALLVVLLVAFLVALCLTWCRQFKFMLNSLLNFIRKPLSKLMIALLI